MRRRKNMEKCIKVAGLFIASLQSLAIIHTRNHWLCKGDNFYSEHNLFERLYDAALEDLDSAAEKFVGLFGPECLDLDLQTSLIAKATLIYKKAEGDHVAQSLAAERNFLKLCADAYACFEEHGKMTLGLDDFIMAMANSHEEAVYLLQQNSNQ